MQSCNGLFSTRSAELTTLPPARSKSQSCPNRSCRTLHVLLPSKPPHPSQPCFKLFAAQIKGSASATLLTSRSVCWPSRSKSWPAEGKEKQSVDPALSFRGVPSGLSHPGSTLKKPRSLTHRAAMTAERCQELDDLHPLEVKALMVLPLHQHCALHSPSSVM